MVVRCHFDLYSSRGVQIDPCGDDFANIKDARRMSRSLLLDFALHHFSNGDEFTVVCKIMTKCPERYYLTSLVMIDEIVTSFNMNSYNELSLQRNGSEEQEMPELVGESEIAYRMSGDWKDLREINGERRLTKVDQAERAWFMSYIPRHDHSRIDAAIDRAIKLRAPFNIEHRVIRADNSIGWTRSRALPVVDECGQIREWIGVAKDVTAHH